MVIVYRQSAEVVGLHKSTTRDHKHKCASLRGNAFQTLRVVGSNHFLSVESPHFSIREAKSDRRRPASYSRYKLCICVISFSSVITLSVYVTCHVLIHHSVCIIPPHRFWHGCTLQTMDGEYFIFLNVNRKFCGADTFWHIVLNARWFCLIVKVDYLV